MTVLAKHRAKKKRMINRQANKSGAREESSYNSELKKSMPFAAVAVYFSKGDISISQRGEKNSKIIPTNASRQKAKWIALKINVLFVFDDLMKSFFINNPFFVFFI